MFEYGTQGILRRFIFPALAVIGASAIIIFFLALIGAGLGGVRSPAGNGLLAAITAVFSREESIRVEAKPDAIPSGSSFHLSWVHETKRRGTYRLLAGCPLGVEIRQLNRDAKLCAVETEVHPDQFLLLSATNQNAEPSEVRLNIMFSEEVAKANRSFGAFVIVRVEPASKLKLTLSPTPPLARTPPPTAVGAPPPPREPSPLPVGPRLPDFTVRIIDVGTTTPDAKQFFPAAAIRRSDVAAVLFEVSNTGGAPAPAWQFEAFLPVETSTFNPSVQPPIPAGGAVRFILGFSGLYSPGAAGPGGSFLVTVNVDPKNEIKELNENNNSAVETLPVVFD